MARRRGSDLAVGAVFALALITLSLAIMAVGGESRLFVDKAYYAVTFPSADGLVVGSPVKMSGVVVGSVSAIRLSKDPQRSGIEVEIGVDEGYSARIREDSRAALRILQILSGEKFVEVIPGSPESPMLAERAEIVVEQAQELLEQAAVTAENVNDITVSLKSILAALQSGEGLMGKMINDPTFGEQGLEALRGTLENLENLTAGLRRGQGVAGRLLRDPALNETVDNLATVVERVSTLVAEIDPEKGALGALLQEGAAGEQAIDDLRAAAGSLRRVTAALEAPEGLIGRLLHDREYSDQIAADLGRITGNLAEITEKLNRGDGTLGALINERVLYEGMENVVAGVNDSKFARWLMRRYRKRGIVAQEAETDESPPMPAEP